MEPEEKKPAVFVFQAYKRQTTATQTLSTASRTTTTKRNQESRIPEDFGSSFPQSDVILRTLNSNGKDLHASKTILATYSPYFEAMFCGGDWAEKNAGYVDLEEDYNVVLEALRLIHHVNKTYNRLSLHEPTEIFELYCFADKCDIPFIRELCEQELEAQVTVESLEVAVLLGLHGVKSKLLEEMDPTLVKQFFEKPSGNALQYSKKDVKIVAEKLRHNSNCVKCEMLKNLVKCTKCNIFMACTEELERCIKCGFNKCNNQGITGLFKISPSSL